MIAFHGTNQSFDAFDPDKLGFANPNSASRAAVFLARTETTAWDYAESAARKLIPDHDAHEARIAALLERAQAAERRRDHALSEALQIEAERIESEAIAAPPSGARVLVCQLDLQDPLEVDGASIDVMRDLNAILTAARAAGHDGVIFRGICDTPSGTGDPDDHIAVFDVARIRILEVRLARDPETDLSM